MLGDRKQAVESTVYRGRSKPYAITENGVRLDRNCHRCGIPLATPERPDRYSTGLCTDCLHTDKFYREATGIAFKPGIRLDGKCKEHMRATECKRGHHLVGANVASRGGDRIKCKLCNIARSRSNRGGKVRTTDEEIELLLTSTDEHHMLIVKAALGENDREETEA